MAGRYAAGREALAAAWDDGAGNENQLDLLDDLLFVLAFEAAYVPNFETDGYVDRDPPLPDLGWFSSNPAVELAPPPLDASLVAVPGYVAASGALTGKSVSTGRLNANDPLFVSLPAAKTITQLVVVASKDVRPDLSAGSPHFAFIPLCCITHDTSDVPISFSTGSGGDLIVRWEDVAPFIYEV